MRKTIFIVLLALVALAPMARAQAPRGYYDQYGQYHEYSQNDGYYDRNGQWHAYDNGSRSNGYYDTNGVWHPNDTQSGGYYDQSGRWHAYDDRYGRAAAPTRWTWSDNRGRAESLSTAARNLASTVSALGRESYRRSGYDDPAALDALRRLDETTREFARVAQTRSRGDLVGTAYAGLVDSYFAARDRFGALGPDGRQSNLFEVMSSALGRIDKRYFGSRVFAGQNPADAGYAYDRSNGYDRYGNPLPGYDRSGRDTRPYPY
jgi:hypothetical protein